MAVGSAFAVLASAWAVHAQFGGAGPEFNPLKPARVKAGDLQKKYAYEPLAPRLAYEKDRKAASVQLTGDTVKRFAAFEETLKKQLEVRPFFGGQEATWNDGEKAHARRITLAALHRYSADTFISAESFGIYRMSPSPNLRYLELAEADAISFDVIKDYSLEEDLADKVTLPKDGADNPLRLPTTSRLEGFHSEGEYSFLNLPGWGYAAQLREPNKEVKVGDVSGFVSHQFRHKPSLNAPANAAAKTEKPAELWQIRRLELVSLLKHEKPTVYVSESLPRMTDLKKAQTRDLNVFEEEALKSLQKGDDLVTTATANQIRLLGSLRAGKQCMQCHSVERGELLGAFTYELWRSPPIRPAE